MNARLLHFLIVLFFSLQWNASAAQEAPDFAKFDRFAASAEQSIESLAPTDDEFQTLRENLEVWRRVFLGAQSINSVRIEALNAQLDALGPAPSQSETESDSVAARREELGHQLTEANAPRIAAEEAHARADTLVDQIDLALRDRQTDALFRLQRTPVDPTIWGGATASLGGVIEKIRDEIADSSAAKSDHTRAWQRLAIAGFLLLTAVLLILRGPNLIGRLLARIETGSGEHGRVVYGFLVSFGGVLVAMIGVSLINAALISTGILGEIGRATSIGINAVILALATGRWLGGRIFPEREAIPSPLTLNDNQRSRGRLFSLLLGLLAGLAVLLDILHQTADFDLDHLGVLRLPIYLAMGLVMFRLGHLVRIGGQALSDEDASFGNHIERFIGMAVQFAAVAGPLAAVVGLQALADKILVPTASCLALFAFLASLHFAIQAAHAMIRGIDGDQAKQALAPVLISFFIALASLPVFALLWGARSSDIGEVWTRFKAGIRLGESVISPSDFITFVVVFALGYIFTRLLQGTLRSSVLPRTKIDKGGQNAIVSGLGYLGITIASIAGISAAGIDLSSFAIIIGALGVGIGFGLQNIVNNFVSGIILLIERPISEGDWVEVNGRTGIVKTISVRSTVIETFDRTDVIVPNGDLISGTVTNWTRGNSIGRVIVPVGVAYGTDTRQVEAILSEIAQSHPIVSVTPAPVVVFQGFGADSMDFEIRAILTDVNYLLSVKSDLNHEIARRFAEENIEIPFAQRDIWLRNPETMAPTAQRQGNHSLQVSPSLGGLDSGGASD